MLVFSRVTLRTESVEITSSISLLAVGLFKLSVLFGHTWYGGSRLCGIAPYYIGCQADTGVDVLFLTILCSWEKSLQHPGDRVWFGHLVPRHPFVTFAWVCQSVFIFSIYLRDAHCSSSVFNLTNFAVTDFSH